MLTIFGWNFEIWAVQKHVNLVDLIKSFPTSIYLQNFKIGVDTAENEPLEVWGKIQFITIVFICLLTPDAVLHDLRDSPSYSNRELFESSCPILRHPGEISTRYEE